MAAEVVCNGDVQFQNALHSQNLDNPELLNTDSFDLSSFDLMLQENDSFDEAQKSDSNIGADDLLNVDMFDFGLGDETDFDINFLDENDLQQSYPSIMTNTSNGVDSSDALMMVPTSTCVNEEDNVPLLSPAPISAINGDVMEQNAYDMLNYAKNDSSDGFTDMEDHFGNMPPQQQQQQQQQQQPPFMNDQRYYGAPSVPVEQNPLYNDIRATWPPLNEMQCGNCQCYRQIIHSNGVQDTKLEIHGGNGQFYHAVMHTRCSVTGMPTNVEQQTVQFAMGTTEYVKQFLYQYSLLRKREGFVIRYDSLSPYPEPTNFDAADPYPNPSAGMFNPPFQQAPFMNPYDPAAGFSAHNNGFYPRQPMQNQYWYPPYDMNPRGMANNHGGKPHKSNVAAQRERTGKLKISDLAGYFHLPINVAAKELAICPTVLKKICRRNGMRRWPHRKIKSIERIIQTLEQTMAEGNGEGIENIRAEIEALKKMRAQLCAGIVVDDKH